MPGTNRLREKTYAAAAFEVGAQEVPGLQHPAVRLVRTDVTPPDDDRPLVPHGLDESRGLWVVQETTSPGRLSTQGGGISGDDILIVGVLWVAEGPAIP